MARERHKMARERHNTTREQHNTTREQHNTTRESRAERSASARKWHALAEELPRPVPRVRVPLPVLLEEAHDVARFCRAYWDPAAEVRGRARPGLGSVFAGERAEDFVRDLVELVAAVEEAEIPYRMGRPRVDRDSMPRARVVLGDLRMGLGWLASDGKRPALHRQLAALSRAHARARSQDAVAAALRDYAELAGRHAKALDCAGGFDTSLVSEARSLATGLHEISAQRVRTQDSEAFRLRNALATLLVDRMHRIRLAARYVFRRQPAVLRRVTSAYERQRRAAWKKRTKESTKP